MPALSALCQCWDSLAKAAGTQGGTRGGSPKCVPVYFPAGLPGLQPALLGSHAAASQTPLPSAIEQIAGNTSRST